MLQRMFVTTSFAVLDLGSTIETRSTDVGVLECLVILFEGAPFAVLEERRDHHGEAGTARGGNGKKGVFRPVPTGPPAHTRLTYNIHYKQQNEVCGS